MKRSGQQPVAAAAALLLKYTFTFRGKWTIAARCEMLAEESLDTTGEDTGERPGAVRLRKVQQRTCFSAKAPLHGEF